MAAEAAISLLIERLQVWLEEEQVDYPQHVLPIQQATDELQKFLGNLRSGNKSHESYQSFQLWETSILPIVYKVEDMVDTFLVRTATQKKKGFSKTNPLTRPLKFQRESPFVNEIKKFDTEWGEIRAQLANHSGEVTVSESNFPIHQQGRLTQLSGKNLDCTDEESYMIGFEETIEHLADALTTDQWRQGRSRVISVVGRSGSGKTKLAQMVYNIARVRQHFTFCHWTYISRAFEAEKVLVPMYERLIGGKVGRNLPHKELRRRLYDVLQTKRYLIVMDDIWTPSIWDELRDVFPDSKNGSRILITTRNKDIASYADPRCLALEPRLLKDADSWRLFMKRAGIAEDDMNNSELIKHKDGILRKCKGLPQAVSLLGGLLSRKEFMEWSRVLEHPTFGEGNSSISDILALSYQDLPSPLKPVFLYLGTFPRAFEINVRRLYQLWLAEGLARPLHSQERDLAQEDLLEKYFEELLRRNMVEVLRCKSDGSPKTCRLPGILYDFFYSKAVDMGLFYIHRKSDYASKEPPNLNVRRLAEHLDIKSYPTLDPYIQCLRSYISLNTPRRYTPAREIGIFIDNIVTKQGFGLLRVLDLEGVYKPTLSKSLGKLLQLRYLGLRWTALDSLPASVGNLPYLETLDLKHTNIDTLPRSIWSARNLRHLYVNEIHLNMSIPEPSTWSLINLRTLWGLFIGDNKSLFDRSVTDRLVGLKNLGLTCNSRTAQVTAQWISQLTNLRTLRLRSKDIYGQPSGLELSPMNTHVSLSNVYLIGELLTPMLPPENNASFLSPNLKVLTLSFSNLKVDPMPILGKLPQLHMLRLFARSYTGKQMACHHEGFPKLRVLKLWMLEKLEDWIIKQGAMPCLRELEIRHCGRLVSADGLQQLSSLKELMLTNMPMKFVDDAKGRMGEDVAITINNWVFQV
ncbi:Disease resistance protein [Quillaja saponaria]|uniref:Disease resistance protein n=1 Tax=Quillaja saponaria TaxID=32244 RepID=A0AAD7LS51_QUISA|nr:Disease resistance protein [Quillaja saponaria]